MRPETVLARRRDVRWRRVGGEAVVVIQDAGRVAGLNGTAADVLEAVDGTATVAEVVDRLSPRWDVARERLAEDVGRILDELLGLGIVEPVRAPGDAPPPEPRE